jgi:hypothetical protein
MDLCGWWWDGLVSVVGWTYVHRGGMNVHIVGGGGMDLCAWWFLSSQHSGG